MSAATDTKPPGGHHDSHTVEDDKPDLFAHTGPLIEIWLPMMIVVGLMILVGVTTSTGALIGAVAALLVATAAVVFGAVKLASVKPEEEEDEQQQGHASH